MSYDIPKEFKDFTIVPNIYVSDVAFRVRTWRERLLSWPFKPFKRTESIESSMIYFLIEEKIAYCSPKTYSRIKKEV